MEYFVKLPLEMSPSFFTNERLVTIGSKLASSNIQFTPIIEGRPSTVGFIVPKAKSEPVDYMDGIRSKEFTECDCVLPMLVGADTNRNYIVIDMAKMPHLLIAGESGGGKSMLLVAMLLSLLSRVSSDELELIVVDPKLVEMAQFSGLPHLQGRDIITEPRLAQKAFKELCVEMDTRYALIANEIKRTGKSIKNIQGYNKSIKNSGAVDANGKLLEPIKSIVLIVDEYADLAMTCDKQLMESYIQRLGQKARAANIHIILVTQRPSVDVITGNIKTNLVGRISLKTKSVTDSRIILGEGGAETLMGAGDLILSHSSYGGATRVFGAYIPESLEESILSELKNK